MTTWDHVLQDYHLIASTTMEITVKKTAGGRRGQSRIAIGGYLDSWFNHGLSPRKKRPSTYTGLRG